MKLTCLQENLDRGLNIVSRAVATRSTLPITQNILLATDNGRLKLAATNLEISISCWLGAKVEEEGTITLPAGLLGDFIHSMPQDTVSFKLLPAGKIVEMKCTRFEARIHGVDAKDFPPIPEVGEGLNTRIDVEALRRAIPRVAITASAEDSRPVLTGVSAKFKGDTLSLAAADGYRLSVHTVPLAEAIEEDVEVIIPAKTLRDLNSLLANVEEPVQVTINAGKNQILFRSKDLEVVSQLIVGSYPDYLKLVPEGFKSKMAVGVEEFRRAVKTAWIFASEGRGTIRAILEPGEDTLPGKVTLSANSEEVGDDKGEVDAVVEGSGRVAFDGRYLNQLLSVVGDSQLSMQIGEEHTPVLFRPVGDEDYIHIIMPQMVQW